MDKKSILKNYKLAILSENREHWFFLKEEADLQRMIESEEINNGDIVLRLTPETLRIAVEKNFIELK